MSTLVPALKRELAVPGTFDAAFPNTTQADLVGSLADGFAEAQLFGFFPTMALTFIPNADPLLVDWETSEDLSSSGGALVVIYTSIRYIRAQFRTLKTMQRYKAGPVEFETQQAASVLTAELEFLMKRLDDIVTNAVGSARPLASVFDNYLARNCAMSWGGFYPYEWR